jgi:hypothetical protein
MRSGDAQNERVTTPICMLKPEYKAAFALLWACLRVPIEEIADAEWDMMLAPAKEGEA